MINSGSHKHQIKLIELHFIVPNWEITYHTIAPHRKAELTDKLIPIFHLIGTNNYISYLKSAKFVRMWNHFIALISGLV